MKRSPLRRRTSLRGVSHNRRLQLIKYAKLRREYLLLHSTCQICGDRMATDIHHKRGRRGKWLNEIEYWIASCRRCHRRIHDDPAWAKANLLTGC